MSKDVATRYLQLLNSGYELREFDYSASTTGEYAVVVPADVMRVFLYVFWETSNNLNNIIYKLPSGLTVPFELNVGLYRYNMTQHCHMIQMEIGDINNAIQTLRGFWIRKR